MHQSSGSGDAESRPLIGSEVPEDVFARALDVELEKISSFYVSKEGELHEEVVQLLQDISERQATAAFEAPTYNFSGAAEPRERSPSRPRSQIESIASQTAHDSDEESDESDAETTGLTRRRSLSRRKASASGRSQGNNNHDMTGSTELGPRLSRIRSATITDYGEQSMMFSSGLFNSHIMLKKRITSLYVQLCELKSYAQLNKTGFGKVLKKFDKTVDRELRPKYLRNQVETAYPFKPESTAALEDKIDKLVGAFAEIVTHGDEELARKDLRSHLREHVVWERNTVWRDLIGIERRAEAASLGRVLLGGGGGIGGGLLQGDDAKPLVRPTLWTPFGRTIVPSWLASTSTFTLAIAVIAFFALLFTPLMDKPEQQNCLAMLVFVSILWATEVRKKKEISPSIIPSTAPKTR